MCGGACLLDSREAQYKGQRRQRQQASERDITIDMLDYNVKKFAQDEDEFLGLLFGYSVLMQKLGENRGTSN